MKVTITSDPRLLQVLRAVVRWRALKAGFGESEAECLAMAIDEAAANVIRHTYGEHSEGPLTLEIRTYPDRVEFDLEDAGPKVRCEAIRPRSLEDLRPGGLGTYFIQCFMDSSSYDESFSPGNRLKMVKFFRREGAHEG